MIEHGIDYKAKYEGLIADIKDLMNYSRIEYNRAHDERYDKSKGMTNKVVWDKRMEHCRSEYHLCWHLLDEQGLAPKSIEL